MLTAISDRKGGIERWRTEGRERQKISTLQDRWRGVIERSLRQ